MTGSRPIVRPLSESDVDVVRDLVGGSFAPNLSPFMVATQHGWTDYLRLKLAHPELHHGQCLAVVELAGEVVAFGDYRSNAGSGFLSYICVAESARQRGLARALFAWQVEQGGPVDRVSLDVFRDNVPAMRMYESMGFREVEEAVWWSAPVDNSSLTELGEALDVDCPDLHVSVAALERFGFCQIRARVGGRDMVFGRLGRAVVRVPSMGGPHERRLLGALTAAFPDIEVVFAVVPKGLPAQMPAATEVTAAVRMECLEPSLITRAGRLPT